MKVYASSGQIVSVNLVSNSGGVVSVGVDRPLISVQFGASETTTENHCVLSTSKVLQMDGSHALSLQFRIPFSDQGVDGEVDVVGVTSVDALSEITITGAVRDVRFEVI